MDRIYAILDKYSSIDGGLAAAHSQYPHLFDHSLEASDDDEAQLVGAIRGRARTTTYGSLDEAKECCAAPSSVSPPVSVSDIAQVSVASPPRPVIKKVPAGHLKCLLHLLQFLKRVERVKTLI